MHNNIRDKAFVEKLGARNAAAQPGWTRSLEQNLVQLEGEIQGLEERVAIGMRRGVPAAYAGRRVFQPESGTVTPKAALGPMNYIVRDGTTYDIPIIFSGAGVFVAKYIIVSVYLKCANFFEGLVPFGSNPPYFEINVTENAYYSATGFTEKIAVFGGAAAGNTLPRSESGDYGYAALNYFWNLLDSKSGVRLADEFMTQRILLNRSRESATDFDPDAAFTENTCGDGGYFEFDVPFVFERDGQANFLFRPITPFLQYADTENPQSVIVQVELHGFRYETDQDAMQLGALSR